MKTTIALVLFFCMTAVMADWSITSTRDFSQTNQASNITMNFPSEDSVPVVGVAVNFEFFVTNYTFIRFTDFALRLSPDGKFFNIPWFSRSFESEIRSSIHASFAYFFDPCGYQVPFNQTVALHYNATTDSESGQLSTTLRLKEVLPLAENNNIRITCLVDSDCSHFYYIDINNPDNDDLFVWNMTAIGAGSAGSFVTLTVAGGGGNCPTSWNPDYGLHVEKQITNTKSLNVSTVMKGPWRIWVQAQVPASFSATFKLSYTVSPAPKAPSVSPSNDQPAKLPTWVYVLIAVGGIVVVGFIIFGIVKVVRRKKVDYTDV